MPSREPEGYFRVKKRRSASIAADTCFLAFKSAFFKFKKIIKTRKKKSEINFRKFKLEFLRATNNANNTKIDRVNSSTEDIHRIRSDPLGRVWYHSQGSNVSAGDFRQFYRFRGCEIRICWCYRQNKRIRLFNVFKHQIRDLILNVGRLIANWNARNAGQVDQGQRITFGE